MSLLVIAPLLVALLTAVVTLPLRRPDRQRWLGFGGGLAYLLVVGVLAVRVLPLGGETATLVYQVSSWPAPFGISLVADPLSVVFLALTAVVSLAALAYIAIDGVVGATFHPLYQFMLVGISGAFLTGDLFNLFVWFEVMLMSSYVLVVYHGDRAATHAGLQYVVLNLIGSAIMLLGIGGLYATTGTLNMADMARRLAEPAAYGVEPAPVLGIAGLLVGVFALKAGIAPFQFWVPDAYSAAPAPVAAMLAGVVKKVGVYAIVRLLFTVLAPATAGPTTALAFFGPALLVAAAVSIVLGGISALGADDIDTLLAHSSIGQVGFIVLPLSIAATAGDIVVAGQPVAVLGVAASVVYAVNHGLAKGSLFLLAGTIQTWVGTDRFDVLGGLAGTTPVLAGTAFLGLLSLVGIPPLSGFFAKLLVFDAAVRAGTVVPVAAALLGAVLTIAYSTMFWNQGFWGETGPGVGGRPPATGYVAAALAVTLLAVGIGFDPVFRVAIAAGEAAVDSTAYVDAVAPTEVLE
jgi:multicomponent Na+:H+ antiporter subunit D